MMAIRHCAGRNSKCCLRWCVILVWLYYAHMGIVIANPLEDAVAAFNRRDYDTAAAAFMPLAKSGASVAQYGLGLLNFYGRGVPQDYAEAMRWSREAADQGNANAQAIVGLLYANGRGVPKDYAEAMLWYRKAADQGDANAQGNIGESNGHIWDSNYDIDETEALSDIRDHSRRGLDR